MTIRALGVQRFDLRIGSRDLIGDSRQLFDSHKAFAVHEQYGDLAKIDSIVEDPPVVFDDGKAVEELPRDKIF